MNETEVMLKVGSLLESKKSLEADKKGIEEKALLKAFQEFQEETGISLSLEQYDLLKKKVSANNKLEKPMIEEKKAEIADIDQDICNTILELRASMVKEDENKYTLTLKEIGKVVYTPYPPFALTALDQETKIKIINILVDNEKWDVLDFDPIGYIRLQQELIDSFEGEIPLLPGLIKREYVDKSEMKITLSRKKK